MELTTDAGPSTTQRQDARELASSFEKAWKAVLGSATTDAPIVSAFLPPPEDSHREEILHELIQIDLVMRWQRGQRICLEEYLEKFPELRSKPKQLPGLLFAEYCVRHEHGDKPHQSVYDVRFPELSVEVQRLIDEQRYKTIAAPTSSPPSPTLAAVFATSVAPVGQDGVLQVGAGYRLLKRIGSGSFGEVWRAVAPGGIPVAIKIIFRPIDHEFAQRELQSLELIKSLSHPYLVQTQAYWPLDDRLVIVMDLADGSMSSRLKECQEAGETGIPPGELLGYFREAAEAFDYLHSEHVQHRDIKPDNILLLRRHAKVADFGLARLQQSIRLVNATACGTPAYMAPEVWKGKISPHSDQYGLAMTYIELRLGRPPFPATDMVQMMEDHLKHQPDLAPLEKAEQEVILKAVAKDADQRYGSCREFADALGQALGRSITGETVTDLRATLARFEARAGRSALRVWISRCLWMLTACGLGLLLAIAIYKWNFVTFSMDPPSPVMVAMGKTARLSIRLQRGNFNEPVTLGFKGLPAGVKITETTIAGDVDTAQLEVIASPEARSGLNQVLIQATGRDRQIEAALELTVLVLPVGAEQIGDEIVEDVNGGMLFKQVNCFLPGDKEPIEFLAVPKKTRNYAETFYMMKNKVSVGMYRKFAKAHPESDSCKKWLETNREMGDEYPAFGMSVEDAHRFAVELHGRLPSTQQWDTAAGCNEPGDREGPYEGKWRKDSKLDIAIAREGPMKIGEAKADKSPLGFLDMAGNGKEWTRDCYLSQDPERTVPLPPDKQKGAHISLRGRGYRETEPIPYKDLEVSGVATYEETSDDIGFRVVMEP